MIMCTRFMKLGIKIRSGLFRKNVSNIRNSYKSGIFMNSCVVLDLRGSLHRSIIHKENPTRCNSVSIFYFIFI